MVGVVVPPVLGEALGVDGETRAVPLVGAAGRVEEAALLAEEAALAEGAALLAEAADLGVMESMTLCGIVTPALLQRETAYTVVAVVFELRLVSRATAARGGLHIPFTSSELHFPVTQPAILEMNFELEQMHLMSVSEHPVDFNPALAHDVFQEANISILA